MKEDVLKWVVLGCSFLTMFLGASLFGSTGVIHLALLDRFQESVEATAWAGALFGGFFCLSAPLAGIIINTVSCRACIVIGGFLNLVGFAVSSFSPNLQLLYFTYGVLGGIGQALCYTGSYVVVGFYFDKQRSFATGLTVTGFAVGMVVFPVFGQFLIDTYALRGAFLLLGAIGFQVCVFGALVRPHKVELKFQNDRKGVVNEWTFGNVCLSFCNQFKIITVPFLLFCVSILLWAKSLALTSLYLPDYFHRNGSDLREASLLMSVLGIGSIISRILTGLAASEEGLDSKLLYFGSYAIIGLATLLLHLYSDAMYGRVMYAILFGLYTGGTWTLLSPITIEILGLSKLASGFTTEMFCAGTGFVIGPVIGGFLLGKENSYSSVFFYSGMMQLLSSLFGLIMTLFMEKDQRLERYHGNVEIDIPQSDKIGTEKKLKTEDSEETSFL